ncbi:hypothetical protein N7495_008055 [Penicillium taxi]|uniref:uncharacterized protein n=1 Tax=Penicillium taxi TaxID=168475 RepID=UPI002544F84D|nr:uncharacterized protein N7495_008055 [Penicillium taxi]KAJ5888014.1 hypothetical protein N7495_008055 [Penicillium taxi]
MAPFLGLRGNKLQIAAILGVLMPGILSVGYNAALFGGMLTMTPFEDEFPQIDIAHSRNPSKASTLQGVVVAVYTIGGFLGSLSCIWLGDKLGRRRTIMTGSLVQILASVLLASATTLVQLVVGRLFLGVGTGFLLATIPLWQSEISPANKRGAHVVTKGVFSGLGCAMSLFLDYGMSFVKGSVAWRLPSALTILLSMTVFGFITLLPESPRWLIRKDRVAEARYILAALEDADTGDESIEKKINDVLNSLQMAGATSFKSFFSMGPQRTFHRAMLGIGAMAFLQACGVSVVTFYISEIFEEDLLLDQSTSLLLAGVFQLVGPIGGVVCVASIESFGRRKLLLASTIGNAICLALVASLGSQTNNTMAMHGAVVFIFLFHFSYIIGFGGIPYLYVSEVAPLHLRTIISSISISVSWALSILVTSITPIALTYMHQGYFVIFAALNAVMVPLIYYLFPETSGRSLEEMDRIFALSEGIFDVVKVAKRLPYGQQVDGLPAEKEYDMDSKGPVVKSEEICSV